MDGTHRIAAIGLALGLAGCLVSAVASPPKVTGPVVYEKGLRAQIEGTKLRSARLVFADTHVTVAVPGHHSETFSYETIRFQRTHTPTRWSLFDRTYWLTTLPGVPLFYPLGPYSLAGFLGATQAGTGLRARRPGWHALAPVVTPRQCRSAQLLGLMVRALPARAAAAAGAARAAFRRRPRRPGGE